MGWDDGGWAKVGQADGDRPRWVGPMGNRLTGPSCVPAIIV